MKRTLTRTSHEADDDSLLVHAWRVARLTWPGARNRPRMLLALLARWPCHDCHGSRTQWRPLCLNS